jgi:flagellar FliJ protein
VNPQRLKPIRQLAQEREDEQARQFAEQQRALEAQEQRLAELRRYAGEYATPPVGECTSAALLINRRAFSAKLDDAVAQQSRHVEKARGSCEIERARLLIASREVGALDRLAASYDAQERKLDERKSQRELDDHAQRVFRKRYGE